MLIRKRLYAKCGAPPRHRDEAPNNAGRRGTNGERRKICREREIGVYWYLFSNGDGAQTVLPPSGFSCGSLSLKTTLDPD